MNHSGHSITLDGTSPVLHHYSVPGDCDMDEHERVHEPVASMNTHLVRTDLQVTFSMLKRELRADMNELEEKLRKEARREIALACARLKNDMMIFQTCSSSRPVCDQEAGGVPASSVSSKRATAAVAEIRHKTPPSSGSIKTTGGASEPIKEKFFNLQYRAYIAVNDVERNFSKRVGKVLKRVYAALLLISVLIMAAFIPWGLYKIIRRGKYAEIHSEEREWESGSMPLPRIAYKILTAGFSAKLEWCSIADGNHSTQHCERLAAHQCDIGERHNFSCFPSDLHVLGTYGDPMYQYVGLHISLNTTAPSPAQVANVDVSWDQHITLSHNVKSSQLYAGGLGNPVAHELFFQKVVSIEGSPVGFAGRQGQDESQQILPIQNAMTRAYEYSRLDANSSDALSLYFRAHWSQREDFYESYSILKLLETSGGLWTSLMSVVSSFAWTSAVTYAHCSRCIRRSFLHRQTSVI